MRPVQKSNRTRGRGNRKPNGGNSANRVYDSSGPEGKVRGTPQQIIEKYLTLARDAQTSGDRVMSENFLQHAEHYQRILILANVVQPDGRGFGGDDGDDDGQPYENGGGQGGSAPQHQPQAYQQNHQHAPQSVQAPRDEAAPARPQASGGPQPEEGERQRRRPQPQPIPAPQEAAREITPPPAEASPDGMTTIDTAEESEADTLLVQVSEAPAPQPATPRRRRPARSRSAAPTDAPGADDAPKTAADQPSDA